MCRRAGLRHARSGTPRVGLEHAPAHRVESTLRQHKPAARRPRQPQWSSFDHGRGAQRPPLRVMPLPTCSDSPRERTDRSIAAPSPRRRGRPFELGEPVTLDEATSSVLPWRCRGCRASENRTRSTSGMNVAGVGQRRYRPTVGFPAAVDTESGCSSANSQVLPRRTSTSSSGRRAGDAGHRRRSLARPVFRLPHQILVRAPTALSMRISHGWRRQPGRVRDGVTTG